MLPEENNGIYREFLLFEKLDKNFAKIKTAG